MTARLGIELSPTSCRIVEVDGQAASGRDVRVRSFAVLPLGAEETRTKLRTLRRRTAAVVVWSATAEHRQVVVAGGSYESMRTEALSSLAAAGVQTQGVVADIVPILGRPRRGVRQPVVVALASAHEVADAVEPLRAAGIRVGSLTTPAVALASLARQRRAFSVPGAIEAYVAIEQAATCIALVRDATLVAARNLGSGYIDALSRQARARDDIAAELADDIADFVGAIGGVPQDIGQVCVCGALPELRSMTLPLMERLDVEVEPLDSLFGIDAERLPEPAAEFRDRSVELRLAWAVAADWPPPINLLRAQRRRHSRVLLARAAVAAGVVAGLAVGWRVEQSEWWRSTAAPQTRVARANPPRSRAATPAPAPAAPSRGTPPRQAPAVPAPASSGGTRVAPPVASRTEPPAPARVEPPLPARPAPPFVPPPDVGPTIPPAIAQSRAQQPRVAETKPVTPPTAKPAPPLATAAQNKPAPPPPAVAVNKPAPAPVPQTRSPFVPPPDVGPTIPAAIAQSRARAAQAPPVAQTRPPAPPPSAAATKPAVPAQTPPAVAQAKPPAVPPAANPAGRAPAGRAEPPAVSRIERPPTPPSTRTATPQPQRSPASAARVTEPSVPPSGRAAAPTTASKVERPAPSGVDQSAATRVERPAPSPVERPPTRLEPPPAAAPALPMRSEPPPQVRTEPPARVAPPSANRGETPRSEPASRPRPPAAEAIAPRPPAAARARPAPQEPALPFDAMLGTILYSPDRKLAIVDGRIVGVGDQVRGARITDITQSSVLLRDAQGRLRQLTLGAGGR